MASLIPGYEYDIFISYRQKDNKGDRWVSEFVEALKTELEATFKEDVSVYFDENLHDRLQETHNVDKSLESKLQCLIFIPILSQTYCDPKSYAWQYEFMPFVKLTRKDRFGRDIKLRKGNYASRILPIRIHDLEKEDVELFEKETGSVLRAMDFVFKTASGVNRPLKANEDHPLDNLNKTYYSDQINKVALAIKEIIIGMKAEPVEVVKEKPQHKEVVDISKEERKPDEGGEPGKSSKSKLLLAIPVLAILIVAAVLFYPKIFKHDKFKDIINSEGKISIAVMPFENLTGDTTLNWFQRGISSLIINGLGNSSELAVCDDNTMFEMLESFNQVYSAGISPSLAREVAKKTKTETYISGSFQGREDTYWVMVNLVNTETGNILWTNKIEGNLKSSAYLVLADSLCNEIKNYLEIKALEDIADYDFRDAYPMSAEAYRYFIEGMNLVLSQNYESGTRSLKKAVEIDSSFTFASFYLAYAYNVGLQQSMEQTAYWTNKAYMNKERVPQKYQLLIEMWYASYISKNLQDINRYCDLLAESGINTRLFWNDLGLTYSSFLQNYDKAAEAFEKVVDINMERGDKWEFVHFWDAFLEALHKTGNHEREKEIAEIGLVAIPNSSNWIYYRQAVCALSRGDTIEADEVLEKYFAKHKELGTPVLSLELFLGQMYEEANIMDQAEIHFRKFSELYPESYARYYFLAKFLIMNEINVDEGMGLIHKALEMEPDNEFALREKGIGLYKQGRYEEAVQLLSKLRDKYSSASYEIDSYLEAAKKAVADQTK